MTHVNPDPVRNYSSAVTQFSTELTHGNRTPPHSTAPHRSLPDLSKQRLTDPLSAGHVASACPNLGVPTCYGCGRELLFFCLLHCVNRILTTASQSPATFRVTYV
jgi:hypothetical protein